MKTKTTKQPAPRKLKRLTVEASAKEPASAGIPTIRIEGDNIKQYNKADAEEKAAKEVKSDLRPEILEEGLMEIFARSAADPVRPVFTVALADESGESLRVEFTSAYGAADAEEVDEFFGTLTGPDGKPVDVNRYVVETLVPVFNAKAFEGENGEFQDDKYARYLEVIQKVAGEYGEPCPLGTAKKVTARPSFHNDRWVDFPKAATQAKLSKVLPNTVRIVPIRPKENESAV